MGCWTLFVMIEYLKNLDFESLLPGHEFDGFPRNYPFHPVVDSRAEVLASTYLKYFPYLTYLMMPAAPPWPY